MKIRVMFAAALLCVASTAAQARKQELPMPIAQELPVEVQMSQHELDIDTPDNSGLARDGLLGAMIASGISNAQATVAERRVADIRNLLIDYDFNGRFQAAFRAKVGSEGISPNPAIKVLDTPWDAWLEAGSSATTGQVLKVTPKYAMTYTMDTLYVSLQVALVDRSRKPNGKFKEAVRDWRTFRFEFPLDPTLGNTAELNAPRWQALGSAELQRMLDLGVEQATDMMVYEFSAEGRAEAARKVGGGESGRFQDLKTFGRQLRAGDTWYWLRTKPSAYILTWSNIRGVNPLRGVPAAAAAAASP